VKFCILRSGSSGNCTLIEHENSRILLDAGGMSQRGITELLSEVDLTPDKINAMVATHLHSDHVNHSTISLCRKFGIPLYIHKHNLPVLSSLFDGNLIADIKTVSFTAGKPFSIGSLTMDAFDVSHDAEALTSGFRFWGPSEDRFVSYASDLGCFPEELCEQFTNALHVVLESNHDMEMLWSNPRRTYFHKKRVTSPTGHLSNEQAADALNAICCMSRNLPDRVILCHLSQDHNTPDLAVETVGKTLSQNGYSLRITAALRKKRTEFFELE